MNSYDEGPQTEYDMRKAELRRHLVRSRVASRRGDTDRARYWLDGARVLLQALRNEEATNEGFVK